MIYLDYNATAPIYPEALAALERVTQEGRNPTSIHGPGRKARVSLDAAREHVRALVGAQKMDVIFTGSGTEADLLGVMGLARRERASRGADRILLSSLEHPAVVEAAQALEAEGFRISLIPFAKPSGVDLEGLKSLLGPDVALVCVMLANNETGLVLPVGQVSELCGAMGVPVHCDAVQAAGKMKVDFRALGVSTMAIAGHKFGGPRGAGALITLKCSGLHPLWAGGGQEEGMRSGSHAVALCVAMGEAARLAMNVVTDERLGELAALRDSLEAGFEAQSGARILCGGMTRLSNTAVLGFRGQTGRELVASLDKAGVLVSAGAACHAHHDGPSASAKLLEAFADEGVIRASLGPGTKAEDIVQAIALGAAAMNESLPS